MVDEQVERPRRRRRRGVGWLVSRLLLLAIAVACLPILLVPLYAVANPPWSTLQAWQELNRIDTTRRWVPLEEISPNLVNAVMMSEDGQFCAHQGVDWAAVQEVLDRNADRPRGASTIPMQVAKNMFLWPSRSYLRKGLEIPIAYYLDTVWEKRRTMEIYLNIVEWGPGVFGAEAAAQHWFGKPAANLTASEGALLAVTLPNPRLRNPAQPSAQLRRLAGIIERRARQAGSYVGCLK
ncbi:monofunctional biosynthetic peptidoglycan transglycosylase [Lutibaculum baratangense]|uniref:Biosynthetic peptidoglycan transglycosylase n=1 Tax=Lutibaculum baratangense AMV1 TaxID=631454 RepID=V4QWB9_9HYPH|nr:monofunctional biosynthetic peptidoglycan transglycosylase [Lutibaculum baratangense]ESR24032.1 Monofunctional biosynthetic peptidoglycan transglycosylase [Lutibaculum baratangense AMV1]